MILLLDNQQNLTNIFKEKNIGDAIILHTALDSFTNFLKDKNDKNTLLDKIKTQTIKNKEDIINQYNEIIDLLKIDKKIQKLFKEEFLFNLTDLKKINELQLQKVTYKVNDNEDFDKIVQAFHNQYYSNALLKAIQIDKKNRLIVLYSSTYGLWNIGGKFYFKNIEALSRIQNKIRAIFTLRKLKNIDEFQDFSRINFAIYEDLKNLFEQQLIETFYKSMQDSLGYWRDDTFTYFIKSMHFKEELDKNDLLKRDVKEIVKKEISHKNKSQATLLDMQQTIEKNEEEIHTLYSINLNIDKIDEIDQEKKAVIKAYENYLLKNLQERHKRELEELKLKIEIANQQREKAKKLYLKSLANGNSIIEAINNLKAAKYNDIVINEVLEDVKSEILLSIKKDEIIHSTKKNLKRVAKTLDQVIKKLDKSEQARETNYKRYLDELKKRKVLEENVVQLVKATEELKNIIISKNDEIIELKNKINILNQKINELEEENNKLYKK